MDDRRANAGITFRTAPSGSGGPLLQVDFQPAEASTMPGRKPVFTADPQCDRTSSRLHRVENLGHMS